MEFIIPDFSSMEVLMSLLTLTFLEIVLGIDNIIFISISTSKLQKKEQSSATRIGLMLAMVMRIVLLFGISWLVALDTPWFSLQNDWVSAGFTGQSVILIVGGIFLLYKSTTEIHHKLDGVHEADASGKKVTPNFTQVIFQIILINIVFSFDSILTAVGMTSGLNGALLIMVIAVIISVLIMMMFAVPVGRFVNKHPSIQMLGLAFLILIGFMLIAEGAHKAHLVLAGTGIGMVPKGYLYFAITFSLFVEFLNMRIKQKRSPVQLQGIKEDATLEGKL